MRNFIIGILTSIIALLSPNGGKVVNTIPNDENKIVMVSEKASPSVVTISITQDSVISQPFVFDPFGGFNPPASKLEKIQKDIGTGFIVDEGGLVVTNKHVVLNTTANYKVITKDNT